MDEAMRLKGQQSELGHRLRSWLGRWVRHIPLAHALRLRLRSRQRIFTDVYASRAWRSAESGSGTGSEVAATAPVREALPELLRRLGIKTLLDAPCGDWNWMRLVELPVERYWGVDIVPTVIEANRRQYGSERIRFECLDLTADPLPEAELILCRSSFFHFSFADIRAAIANFRRTGAGYLLTNSAPEAEHNTDQFTGAPWRALNLCRPPFSFPEPLEMLPDYGDGRYFPLCLWRLADLPNVSGRQL